MGLLSEQIRSCCWDVKKNKKTTATALPLLSLFLCDQILQQILQWPGRWRDRVVGVRLLELRELRDVNRRTKRTMLWMREELQHVNVLRFYGLMQLEEDRYVIGDYCGRGSMLDILHNYK